MRKILKLIFILTFLVFYSMPLLAQDAKKALRVVVFMSQKQADESSYYWWINEMDFSSVEKEVVTRLNEAGVVVIPPVEILSNVKNEKFLKSKNLDNAQLIKLANKINADVIVVGQSVFFMSNLEELNNRAYLASVTARVIVLENVDKNEFIESKVNFISDDLEWANKEVLKQAADDFSFKLIDYLYKIKDLGVYQKPSETLNLTVTQGNATGI